MENLIEQFNSFFKGVAEVRINRGVLEIAIGIKTLLISLPEIIGGQNEPSKPTD
jgi:hypothetical protein